MGRRCRQQNGVVSKIVGSAQLLTFALLWHWRVEAAIGVSRVCLGAHYLSDMLSVAAADLTWLALSLTAVDTSRRNQFVRKIRNGV